MSITEILNEQIKTSMKNKDTLRLSVVRMLKAKILNVNARGEVSQEQAVKIFKSYAKGLTETIAIAKQNGNNEIVEATQQELAIVEEFLPQQLTVAEIEKVVRQVIAENNLVGMAAMGQVMAKSMAQLQGNADGAVVKDIALKFLKG